MSTTGEYIAQGLRDGAHFLGEAIAKSLERIAHEIERVGDNMQVGIVDDEPEGEYAPPNSTEPATVDNSGPDSDPQGAMSWTAERLDALPEGTVIAWEECGLTIHAATEDGSWCVIGGDWIRDRQNILTWASPGSIRVVSVPIDALLSWDACKYAARVVTGGSVVDIITAAIAHATGEAS